MTRHEEIRRLHFHLQAAFFTGKTASFYLRKIRLNLRLFDILTSA